MSNTNLEQLAAAQKAGTEVMMSLMRTAFDGVERLTALNMAASRDFFANTMVTAQQMANAKDVNAVAKLNSNLTKPGIDKWMEYSRNLYDLVSEMQKEVTAVLESQYSHLNQQASSVAQKAKGAVPVGGEVFAATMQSMLDASTKAFGNMSAMAKQLSDIAEANIKAATPAAPAKTSATAAAAKKGAAK